MGAEGGNVSSSDALGVETFPPETSAPVAYAQRPADFASRGVETFPGEGPIRCLNETEGGNVSRQGGNVSSETPNSAPERCESATAGEDGSVGDGSSIAAGLGAFYDALDAGRGSGAEKAGAALDALAGATRTRRPLVLSTPPTPPGTPGEEKSPQLEIGVPLPSPKKSAEKKSQIPGPASSFRVPETEAELVECLKDPVWRVCSGQLYKIMIKSPVKGEDSTVLPFIPNRAQRRLMSRLWHRNIILKARQLGFTTLVCIMWLDHALFNHDQRCGIVAQDAGAAEGFFRDKVKFAYENLPPSVREARPLKKDSSDELLFEHNNSSIRVATSMRSGTIHRLHISEYGKICAKYPDKATEVSTGTLPAVPLDGIVIIESTAEGQSGDFYDKTMIAIANAQKNKPLTQKDFRFHFFPWWQDPSYRIETPVAMSDKDREYFDTTQVEAGTVLDLAQRNWYVSTRDSDFSGDPEKMWQEYPSTAKEAFKVSTEGTYYAVQLAAARKQGRITKVPHLPNIPVDTFWDIGNTDGTAIWYIQRLGYENRVIDFDEGWGEPYSYFTQRMQTKGYTWGTHYLPHDAEHVRQGQTSNQSPKEMLEELLPGCDFECVPRVANLIDGIQATRNLFASCWFDEEKTMLGLAHLAKYRKTWDKAKGGWKMGAPSKVEGDSEAADAFRQRAQMDMPMPKHDRPPQKRRSWRTA